MRWDGDLTVAGLMEVTNARIAFAKEHVQGDYVVILDVREGKIKELNVRAAQWAAHADEHMIHLFIIGKSIMAQTLMNILARLGKWQFEFIDEPTMALERARQLLGVQTPQG
jgi:hypothetical protein